MMDMIKGVQIRIFLLDELPIGGADLIDRNISHDVENSFKPSQALEGGF